MALPPHPAKASTMMPQEQRAAWWDAMTSGVTLYQPCVWQVERAGSAKGRGMMDIVL
jgi:hypothetical protein